MDTLNKAIMKQWRLLLKTLSVLEREKNKPQNPDRQRVTPDS